MFGLADIGYPELGSWGFGELEAIRLPFGMGIERDVLFAGMFPISVWAETARLAGSIREAEQILSDTGSAVMLPGPDPRRYRKPEKPEIRLSGFSVCAALFEERAAHLVVTW